MPLPQQQWAHRIPNPLLQAEQYDVDEMATLVDEQRTIFNPDQAAAFDAVLESVTNNQGHLFFIHAVTTAQVLTGYGPWPLATSKHEFKTQILRSFLVRPL